MNTNNIITPQQKIVAAVLGLSVLMLLKLILPTMVEVAHNLWLLVFYLVPLFLLVFFHQQIWDWLQIKSFNMTKNMISKNPTFFLERGYDYIVGQIKDMRGHLVNSNAIIKETEKQVADYIGQIEDNQRSYERATDASIKKIILAKIGTLKATADSIIPSIEIAKKQRDEMEGVVNNYTADAEILRCKIDSLNTQYELLQQLSSLAEKGRKMLNGSTPQVKEFKESIKLTERKVFEFTANIEGFQKEVFTYSTMKELDSQENQQKGLEVIEKYKQQRLALPA